VTIKKGWRYSFRTIAGLLQNNKYVLTIDFRPVDVRAEGFCSRAFQRREQSNRSYRGCKSFGAEHWPALFFGLQTGPPPARPKKPVKETKQGRSASVQFLFRSASARSVTLPPVSFSLSSCVTTQIQDRVHPLTVQRSC
jgi:hypothetical protein